MQEPSPPDTDSSIMPEHRRSHLASVSRAINLLNVQTGEWIRENTGTDETIGVNDAGAIRYFGKRRTIDLMGLNNSDIAFRRRSPEQIFSELDWFAVLPNLLRRSPISAYLERRKSFHVPQEEYTICKASGQNTIVVYRKKAMGFSK